MSKNKDRETVCREFFANPEINPRTGRTIKPGGKPYKELVQECGEPPSTSTQAASEAAPAPKAQKKKAAAEAVAPKEKQVNEVEVCRNFLESGVDGQGDPIEEDSADYRCYERMCDPSFSREKAGSASPPRLVLTKPSPREESSGDQTSISPPPVEFVQKEGERPIPKFQLRPDVTLPASGKALPSRIYLPRVDEVRPPSLSSRGRRIPGMDVKAPVKAFIPSLSTPQEQKGIVVRSKQRKREDRQQAEEPLDPYPVLPEEVAAPKSAIAVPMRGTQAPPKPAKADVAAPKVPAKRPAAKKEEIPAAPTKAAPKKPAAAKPSPKKPVAVVKPSPKKPAAKPSPKKPVAEPSKPGPAKKPAAKRPAKRPAAAPEKKTTASKKKAMEKLRDEMGLGDIDPFDFEKYPKDLALFKKYFDGLELYLRLALWIFSRYYDLDDRQIRELLEDLKEAQDEGEEAEEDFLADKTEDSLEKELLSYWYLHWNQDLANLKDVDRIFNRYYNCEEVLFNRLYRKYVDPDWEDVELWMGECENPPEGDVEDFVEEEED
jgi:hypothetical protein